MSPVARQTGGDASFTIVDLPSPVELIEYVPACQHRDVGQRLAGVVGHVQVIVQGTSAQVRAYGAFERRADRHCVLAASEHDRLDGPACHVGGAACDEFGAVGVRVEAVAVFGRQDQFRAVQLVKLGAQPGADLLTRSAGLEQGECQPLRYLGQPIGRPRGTHRRSPDLIAAARALAVSRVFRDRRRRHARGRPHAIAARAGIASRGAGPAQRPYGDPPGIPRVMQQGKRVRTAAEALVQGQPEGGRQSTPPDARPGRRSGHLSTACATAAHSADSARASSKRSMSGQAGPSRLASSATR